MLRITVEPQNPRDLSEDYLSELIQDLRAAHPEAGVRYAGLEQKGYGVTWWEVLRIWVTTDAVGGAVAGALVTELVNIAVGWARGRLDREGPSKRPKYVAILGPDGKVLKSVLVRNSEDEPEDHTDEDRREPPRRLPRSF